ncbi:MAG: SnoaL-like domain [Solirubrobacterales bacterium]|jgi:ketosteroid isomerase-like protein|nr:SnoaL-like domain [Solirubrobacterales bacterium]
MSQENVELVGGGWAAFQRGDVAAMRADCHPDVLIVQPPEVPDTKTYSGLAGVKEAVEDWPKQWDDFQFEVLELIDFNDTQVVSVTRHRGRGAMSGIEMDAIVAYVHTIREGKLMQLDMFFSKEQALEAAGQQE